MDKKVKLGLMLQKHAFTENNKIRIFDELSLKLPSITEALQNIALYFICPAAINFCTKARQSNKVQTAYYGL